MTPTEQAALAFFKSVAMRFIKGAVAGAAAALTAQTIQVPTTWMSLQTALVTLAYSAAVGFVAGGLLALEKWYGWQPTAPTTP